AGVLRALRRLPRGHPGLPAATGPGRPDLPAVPGAARALAAGSPAGQGTGPGPAAGLRYPLPAAQAAGGGWPGAQGPPAWGRELAADRVDPARYRPGVGRQGYPPASRVCRRTSLRRVGPPAYQPGALHRRGQWRYPCQRRVMTEPTIYQTSATATG